MKVAVVKETGPAERRVALVPDAIAKLRSAGHEVLVERGAGDGAFIPDDAFTDAGVAAQVTRVFTLVGVFFSSSPVRNYGEARAADHSRYALFFHGLLVRGVYIAPSGYEMLDPSMAHTDADIERTIEAVVESLHRV